jgi:hypothetical protein
LFGTGSYRRSDVYMAVTSLASIEDKSALRYFGGMDANSCAPTFVANEQAAVPLFHTAGENISPACVGELSVHYSEPLGRWLALYNCGDRIDGRVASSPWGPWSEAGIVYDPVGDGGYCSFIYAGNGSCAGLSDPGRQSWVGVVYGPYAIPRYSTPTPNGVQIYFVMSPWNPYDTMLMRAELQLK